MTALGSDPAVDQHMVAVGTCERVRPENAHLAEGSFIMAAVERIILEYGPATEYPDGAAVPVGLLGVPGLRWVRRPNHAYPWRDGVGLDAAIDVVVPLRGVDRCDHCDREAQPRWVLLVPTPPSHLVFLVCDGCRVFLDAGFAPIRWDPYLD